MAADRSSTHPVLGALLASLVNADQLATLPVPVARQVLLLARRAGVSGRWFSRLTASGALERVHGGLAEQLYAEHLVALRRRETLAWEIEQLTRALRGLDLPLIVLKGGAYHLLDLPLAAGRLTADVDILVPRRRLGEVESACRENGWQMKSVSAYDDNYYREWMHELPPMVHSARGTAVDIHHNILPTVSRVCPPAAALMESARPVPGSDRLQVLQPVDMLLHSSVHAFHDGECLNPIRDVLDIHDLAQAFAAEDNSFWPALERRANELGFTRPTWLALSTAKRYLGLEVPAPVLEALRASGARPLRDQIFARALDRVLPAPLPAGTDVRIAARILLARAHLHKMPPLLLCRHLAHKLVLRLSGLASKEQAPA